MLDKKSFGERISRLRSQKAVSQQSLAQYLGIGKSAVSMMESGQRAASADILTALANYFDVPVDYLLGNGIYGQLQSVPKLKEVLATEIEKQLGADLIQSLLGGPLSAADDVTFGKIADLLVEEIQIGEDGSIVIQFKG